MGRAAVVAAGDDAAGAASHGARDAARGMLGARVASGDSAGQVFAAGAVAALGNAACAGNADAGLAAWATGSFEENRERGRSSTGSVAAGPAGNTEVATAVSGWSGTGLAVAVLDEVNRPVGAAAFAATGCCRAAAASWTALPAAAIKLAGVAGQSKDANT